MKTLICGDIPQDDVMTWCIENKKFHQRDIVRLGERWGLQDTVHTNLDMFVYGFRLGVKHGTLSHTEIDIIFRRDGEEFRVLIDKNGNLDWYPRGFFDAGQECLLELIGW